MPLPTLAALLALLALAAAPSAAPMGVPLPIPPLDPAADPGAEPWGRFRGPAGAGVAPDALPLPAALDPAQNLRWKREVAEGESSPAVWGERVFVTGHAGNELVVLCLAREDGEVLWRRSLQVEALERTHEVHGPASPTPATDGERVVAHFGSFGLVCFDLEGRELWRRPLPIPRNTFGTAASPVFAGGSLIFLQDAEEGAALEAIDPATGATRWRREREGFRSGWSTPATWRVGEADELLVQGAWWLTAYGLEDGAERWSFPGLTDEPVTTPVSGEGLVFVTSYNMRTNPEVIGLPPFEELLAAHDHDGNGALDRAEAAENESVLSRPDADGEGDHPLSMFFRFLDVDASGGIDAEEWTKLVAWVEGWEFANAVLAIRPGTTERPAEIAWQFPRGVPECPSPLYYRGRVYLVMNGGLATCLEAASGALRFQGRLGPRGPFYASPVAGDGKVYAASARGEVAVFAAADTLEVLSTTDLGERVMATPALSGGTVFVRTDRHVLAFHDAGAGPPQPLK